MQNFIAIVNFFFQLGVMRLVQEPIGKNNLFFIQLNILQKMYLIYNYTI